MDLEQKRIVILVEINIEKHAFLAGRNAKIIIRIRVAKITIKITARILIIVKKNTTLVANLSSRNLIITRG